MISAAMIAAGVNFATEFLNGISERKSYQHKARSYAQQAEQLRKNAFKVRAEGSLNEDIMREQNRAEKARYLAVAGEAGLGESPTTAAVAATEATVMEQNVLNHRYQTETEAENYLYQARIAEADARQMRRKKRHAFQKSFLKMTASFTGE